MMESIGFIGCGNMGGAIARAVCKATDPKNVLLANRSAAKAEALAAELGCRVGSNEAAAGCSLIFLGVKPQMMADMLAALRPVLAARTDRFVLCSMAAGLSMARIQEMAGGAYPVIRIMPNTPCAVGEGLVQYCSVGTTAEEDAELVRLLTPAGIVDPITENLADVCSIFGCIPAWTCQYIEALSDGGVACGLPRAKAQLYAAQVLLGTARLMQETGQHPGALKDAVCSPGGSTIQGVRVLEEHGFRGAVIDAMIAAFNRTKEMGKG